jgi:hypothetical protein
LAVAQGFPNVSIDENQVIIPDAFAQFFEFPDKLEPNKELFDPTLKLNLTFDILSFYATTKEKKDIAEALVNEELAAKNNLTRSQMVIKTMNLP